MENQPILVTIKLLHYQGQQLLGQAWAPFCEQLREALAQSGFAAADSADALLLFSFSHPYAALIAIRNHLAGSRRLLHGQLGDKPLPVQIIIHLFLADASNNTPYRNPEAGVWELLPQEVIHINKPLKEAWNELMAQRTLPACIFAKEGRELFALHMEQGEELVREPILPGRAVPVQGKGEACFYCGMRNHRPGQCPSKLLSMEHNGLEAAGYLSFTQLRASHAKVFANSAAVVKAVAAGVAPPQIRKNPGLMVFIGFFDINRVYQIRFLWNLTFSRFSKWQSAFMPQAVQVDNKNLQLGIDCLRVGKYGQAEEFLGQEYHAKSARRFSAAIGLAFIALEKQGLASMRSYLEVAKSLATQPKDRIYIDLLLTRFYDMIGETWKGRDLIKSIATFKDECPEAAYRKLQLEAKGSFSAEASQLLRTLLTDQRTFFVAALLDPALSPIEVKVEDLLSSQFEATFNRAQDVLSQVSREISGLELWFPTKEEELESSRATLDTLHTRLERKSYFDALDVENKAKILLESSRQLRERKLNDLYDHITKVKVSLADCLRFWEEYRYQVLFKKFGLLLQPLHQQMREAQDLARESDGAAYVRAVELLAQAEQALVVLNEVRERMQWVAVACDCALSFARKLGLLELGGGAVAAGLVGMASNLADGQAVGGFLGLIADPLFQRKALVLAGVVVAPLIALVWAIAEQIRGSD